MIAFGLPNLVTDLLGIGHVTVCGIQKHKIRGEGRYKPALGAEREREREWKTGSGRGLNSDW